MTRITLRISSPAPIQYCWLVLAGDDAHIVEREFWCAIPCEQTARLAYNIPPDVPILIGRA